MFIKSIRWRLQIWSAALLLVLLAGFGTTAYQLNRISRLSQLDEELERRVALVSGDVRGRLPRLFRPPPEFGRPEGRGLGPRDRREPGPPPLELEPGPPPRGGFPGPDLRIPGSQLNRMPPEMEAAIRNIQLSAETADLFDESSTNGFYYAIWSPQEVELKRSSNAPPLLRAPERPGSDTSIRIRTWQKAREGYHFTELGECILVGRPITGELQGLRRFAWLLVGAGAIVLSVGLGGGWILAGRALLPVGQIGAAAGRISSGNLSERVQVAETDGELGRLAAVLNSTFDRLEAAFAQQRQFTADASHELRTPLTVLISEAQTALARERSAAEYRETVQVCLQTAQQMRRLTESLMKLARFDAGQEVMDRHPVDLAQLAAACVEWIRPLAEPRKLGISTALQPALALADADRIGQVVTNLLSNAIQFNREAGRITVTTGVDRGMAFLEVSDTGQGIAPEDLPRVFERFYRADKSRTRANGHAGLGLAICKAIVDAHGGTVSVSSRVAVGTVFTVRLPEWLP